MRALNGTQNWLAYRHGLLTSFSFLISLSLLLRFPFPLLFVVIAYLLLFFFVFQIHLAQQWGAADAEIKVSSGENTELKRSPFKAWSRSVHCHACYAYCQGFLSCLFLPFWSIHLHFFQNLSRFFLCWLWLTHGSCVGKQNKIGHPAGGRLPCWVPAEYKQAIKKTLLLVLWLVKWITWR